MINLFVSSMKEPKFLTRRNKMKDIDDVACGKARRGFCDYHKDPLYFDASCSQPYRIHKECWQFRLINRVIGEILLENSVPIMVPCPQSYLLGENGGQQDG